MSDANVTQDDPTQLHMVFSQIREEVLAGKHPIDVNEIPVFAALLGTIFKSFLIKWFKIYIVVNIHGCWIINIVGLLCY